MSTLLEENKSRLPLSPADRKRMVRERCERSITWRVIHLLGSLKIALFLLATIAVACAVATFYEAEFSAAIASHYVYRAPWFLLWLAVLCINLFAVTLTRLPWEKKHTGFIVTHYGIIILLIGAMIGSRAGFEGNVTLDKTQPPLTRLTTSKSIIQIEDPETHALYTRPFDALVTKPTEKRPREFQVPGTDWKVVAIDHAEKLTRVPVLRPVENGAPAAVLRLTSLSTNGSQEFGLQSGNPDRESGSLSGMANLRILETLPDNKRISTSENRMVFLHNPPVRTGTPSPVEVQIVPGNRTVEIRSSSGTAVRYALQDVLGKEISFGENRLQFREFWPDFELVDGRPSSKSDNWNNPALLVQIQSIEVESGAEASSLAPEFQRGLWLLVAVDSSKPDTLDFQLWRNGMPEVSGSAAVGQSFATGWNDWNAEVGAVSNSAEISMETRPVPPEKLDFVEGFPGFFAYLDAGENFRGEPAWVESGKVATLSAGHRFVRIGYGLQLKNMPFSIRLLDFEVPRFEGTQTPSNFIATVEFLDPATGETKQDTARMNKPANWPGGVLPLITGRNYKFSQAEWNPDNLNETTLQVLYDPGWLFKWIGSLAICAGIGILFYWNPSGARKKQKNDP